MIVGFRVDKEFDLVQSVLNKLSRENNHVSIPDSSVKGVSANMLRVTSGSVFQCFDYVWFLDSVGNDWVFVLRVELLSVSPKIDYFFNLLVSCFGLKRFILFCVKKRLKLAGWTGNFSRVNSTDINDYLWGVQSC